MTALILLHAAVTLMMTGVIWFVQLVHYPLFAAVDASGFTDYARQHVRRTTWVVAPLMLIEGITAALLLVRLWDSPGSYLMLAGGVLLLIIWLSAGLLQVPCHRRLDQGYDPAVFVRLVRTNWIRTVGWSLRSVLAGVIVWRWSV